MYGLINSALKGMMLEQYGNETWNKVLKQSGVPEDSFLSMRSYDDKITYDLVGATSEVLGAPPEACLKLFGQYWVMEVATEAYQSLMDASGQNLIEFLANLNALHDRINNVFLNYVPPEFVIEPMNDGTHRIHYISQRQGLTPFVDGLLEGLAEHFGEELTVISCKHEEREHGTHAIYQVNVN
jgi:guanylate cyclase soluble subunit beta